MTLILFRHFSVSLTSSDDLTLRKERPGDQISPLSSVENALSLVPTAFLRFLYFSLSSNQFRVKDILDMNVSVCSDISMSRMLKKKSTTRS